MSDQSRRLTIVRHADAGSRAAFDGPDDERPITARGRAQSYALAGVLEQNGVTAIVSSPAVRCVETVEPLAGRVGVTVETDEALAEESSAAAVLAVLLARSTTTAGLVVGSTHGPIFRELLDSVDAPVAGLAGRRTEVAKAGRLELTIVDGSVTAVEAFDAPRLDG